MNYVMKVKKIQEAGYEAAMQGLAFNKKQEKDMSGVAMKLAGMDFGHNKFLESVQIWVEVNAPRYWWQEADTFRLSTKQSESTMHTLIKELKSKEYGKVRDMFENSQIMDVSLFQKLRSYAEDTNLSDSEKLVLIKQRIPEGFLQKRLWCFNYKCLRNIIIQRKNHRLPHWQKFIKDLMSQLDHPELLTSALD